MTPPRLIPPGILSEISVSHLFFIFQFILSETRKLQHYSICMSKLNILRNGFRRSSGSAVHASPQMFPAHPGSPRDGRIASSREAISHPPRNDLSLRITISADPRQKLSSRRREQRLCTDRSPHRHPARHRVDDLADDGGIFRILPFP